MAQTYKFGNGTWANKEGSTLAYNDEGNNYKPLPFSFERDSIATRVNKEGLIEVVGKDQPRIDYTDSAEGVLLLEPQSTNLITYSEDFSQWIKKSQGTGSIPILTTNNSVSPNGNNNGTRLQCSLNGGNTSSDRSYIYLSGFNATPFDCTKSLYVKNNLQVEQVLFLGINQIADRFTLSVSNDWQRIEILDEVLNSQFRVGVQGGGGNSDSIDIEIWGAMLEANSFSTSYIPTSGSTVQRAAETANGSGNSEVFNDSEGVLFADVSSVNDGQYKFIGISDGTNSNRLGLFIGNSNNKMSVESVGSGTNLGIYDKGINTENNNKIALKYKPNNCSLWVNGFEIGVDTSFAAFTNGTLTELSFYRGDNNFDFYGKTKEIGYYDTALTDLELETLTSYRSLNELVTELNLNTL